MRGFSERTVQRRDPCPLFPSFSDYLNRSAKIPPFAQGFRCLIEAPKRRIP